MKEIDTILSKHIKENKTPSVQYVFFNRDTITYSFQSGLADIKNQRKIKEKALKILLTMPIPLQRPLRPWLFYSWRSRKNWTNTL